MTTDELYKQVLEQMPIKEIHPLHRAILEECCENALNNSQDVTDTNTLIYAVHVAFLSCNSTLKETLAASLQLAAVDHVTLSYRNQTFTISKKSPLLK